jgi:hypothetical protein
MNFEDIENILPNKRLKYLFTMNNEDRKTLYKKIERQPQKKWRKTLRNHFNWCHYQSSCLRKD